MINIKFQHSSSHSLRLQQRLQPLILYTCLVVILYWNKRSRQLENWFERNQSDLCLLRYLRNRFGINQNLDFGRSLILFAKICISWKSGNVTQAYLGLYKKISAYTIFQFYTYFWNQFFPYTLLSLKTIVLCKVLIFVQRKTNFYQDWKKVLKTIKWLFNIAAITSLLWFTFWIK
jgi:hypothetical protein